MSKPLMLSIGGQPADPHFILDTDKPQPAQKTEPAGDNTASAGNESLAEMYEAVKRHEETLRDLVVEIRLLYHNLSDKEKKRLEAQRDRTTREVRDSFAAQIRLLEEKAMRLRASK